MKKNKIKSVMVTSVNLDRRKPITKEEMESYCKGEKYEQDSVNNDLESLFKKIRLGKEPDEGVRTYFLPKLTEEEHELVVRNDTSYFQTFYYSNQLETDVMLSESDSIYVCGVSRRKTFVIENSSKKLSKNICSLH